MRDHHLVTPLDAEGQDGEEATPSTGRRRPQSVLVTALAARAVRLRDLLTRGRARRGGPELTGCLGLRSAAVTVELGLEVNDRTLNRFLPRQALRVGRVQQAAGRIHKDPDVVIVEQHPQVAVVTPLGAHAC